MKYFSMFSGIGGFEYGLQNSKYNFECVGFSEVDKYAKSIYIRQFPNHTDFGDATKIKTEELPDFEFLVGGFPCQAFSLAGKRKGFDDTRGTLFFEIARILKDKKPRYFLLENVKGLLSHDRGRTITKIFRVCDELGYDVSWAIYNSKDYGVPQNRERIFIKGHIRRKSGRKILSLKGNCNETNAKLSNTIYGTRAGRIHFPDELMNTLTCSGLNGGSSQLIVEDDGERKLKQLNNHKRTNQSSRVYDSEGLSITLNAAANNGWYKI